MADKEERIFIKKIHPECKFREMHETTAGGESWVDFMCGKSTIKKLECNDKCFEQCEWKELTGISRQEAINRIAKAIKSVPKARGEAVHSTDYAKWAEAALNALLEETK